MLVQRTAISTTVLQLVLISSTQIQLSDWMSYTATSSTAHVNCIPNLLCCAYICVPVRHHSIVATEKGCAGLMYVGLLL